jgi:hypothetical protein
MTIKAALTAKPHASLVARESRRVELRNGVARGGSSRNPAKRPVLVPVSAHSPARERNCALASTICLTMANRSEVLRASRSTAVTVTTSPGSEGGEHAEKLAPVAVRACHVLAINLRTACAAQLLKLGVERLPVGADAGTSGGGGFAGEFRSYLTANVTH